MKKIYLSGRISGLPIEEVKQNFHFARFDVINRHYADIIINPLNIKPLFGIEKWLFFMIADIWQQRKCTHSAFQKNWTESRGAVIEYFFAKFVFKQLVIFL